MNDKQSQLPPITFADWWNQMARLNYYKWTAEQLADKAWRCGVTHDPSVKSRDERIQALEYLLRESLNWSRRSVDLEISGCMQLAAMEHIERVLALLPQPTPPTPVTET